MYETDGGHGGSVAIDTTDRGVPVDLAGPLGWTSRGPCLSHDLPCPACGHARHTFLACSDSCACVPPPLPGLPEVPAARRLGLTA